MVTETERMGKQGLEEKVYGCIEEHGMIRPGDTVYAAVSGGADSVCLLLLLDEYRRRADFSLKAVHVEHGIRGEESLEDERFVRELCARLQVPLHTAGVDAPGLSGREGLSLEEAARTLRYREFEKLTAGAGGAARVALAHHMEDQAETVLLNLARGTGLKGLGGIQPVRDAYIRPLLEASRQEIEAYLRERSQAWREDATNADTRYARNLVRHRILPVLLEGVNDQAVRHICEAARRAGGAARYLEEQARIFAGDHMHQEGEKVILEIMPLRRQERIIREQVLRLAVHTARGGKGLKDVGAVHIADLDGLLFKPRGKHLDLPGRLKAQRVDKTLVLRVL